MPRMRVKNFGPVRQGRKDNDGWIDFTKVTIFVGNQGSGKSTLAKLFATFAWIEKALVRGDYEKRWFERKNRLQSQFLRYHRLENYLPSDGAEDAMIEYEGDAYSITFSGGLLRVEEAKPATPYALPQIMYVPAERNFISYVRHPQELKLSSEALKEFLSEFENAKSELRGRLRLPINDAELEYDKLNDTLNIRDDAYKLRLTDASSGFQSAVPLFLVSHHLAHKVQQQAAGGGVDVGGEAEPMSTEQVERFRHRVAEIYVNESLTNEQRRVAISVLSSQFNKAAFVNVIEEPEQNLFPSSQWTVITELLALNNLGTANRLVLTTHSPYMVNFLSIVIQGHYLRRKIETRGASSEMLQRLERIVPLGALIDGGDVSIYQSDETTGSIQKLATTDGIPSDQNDLNVQLMKGNALFDGLLDIEQELGA
ncbi:AAA family ATPase [Trinickia acidisoli]|uniref:AAA family ATPase n=1 Tax=Trinickia acidisoli TaxID=2767482 RepID=UPI001A8E2087|nr:AAA family ATPase [Trinickia acidisoli]